MRKSGMVRVAVIGALLMMFAGSSAYAPAIEHIFFYYSDSAFTNEVGQEGYPGLAGGGPEWCDDEYWYDGDITAPYRKTVYYSECGWQIPMMGSVCDYYDNGSWHSMPCP